MYNSIKYFLTLRVKNVTAEFNNMEVYKHRLSYAPVPLELLFVFLYFFVNFL